MKRKLWRRDFEPEHPPKYPCPSCDGEGHLNLVGKADIEEPKFSLDCHAHDEWEWDWGKKRFHLKLKCDAAACGEIVHVIGDVLFIEGWDEEFHSYARWETLRPKAMFPAPRFFELPDKTPREIASALNHAFAICWEDTSSAANRVRVSVERVLDDLGIDKSAPTKKGERRLNLGERIKIFEKVASKNKDHAQTFNALRVAGNLGSHGEDVDWDIWLDALVVYEPALEELYGAGATLVSEAKARLLKLDQKPIPKLLKLKPKPKLHK